MRIFRLEAVFAFADQGVVSAANFITALVLARYLGKEGFGIFLLANGLILFISSIQLGLIISPMLVRLPVYKGPERTCRRNVFFLEQLFLCIAGVLGLSGFLFAVSSTRAFGMLWGIALPLIAACTTFLIQDFLRRYFFASLKPSFALINDIVSYGLQITVIILLHFIIPLNASLVFWVMALTSTAAILVGGFQLKGEGSWSNFNKRDGIILARDDWEYGKWLLATNIAYWGGSQLVLYWAAAYISLAEVGAMGAARNVVGVVNIMFLGLQNFMPSKAANVFGKVGYSGLKNYLRRVTFWGFLGTLLFVLLFGIPGEFWLNILYGPAYQGYGWVVLLWGIYFLIGFLHRPFSTGLRILNKTFGIFMANACGAAIALIIGYSLVRYFGLGGCMATLCVIQGGILVVLMNYYFRWIKKFLTPDTY